MTAQHVTPAVIVPAIVGRAVAEVIPCLGQVNPAERRALDRAVREGRIAKWRGYWFPQAGAPVGIGPLKTCYGPISTRAMFAEMEAGLRGAPRH